MSRLHCAVVTVVACYRAAGLVLLLFTTEAFSIDATAPPGNIPDAYSSILKRGVLGGEGGSAAGPQDAPASSPYRLIGTMQSGSMSGAVLDDGTGVQTFYRANQKLPDDSRIVKILRDRVVIQRPDGTVSELVVLDDTKTPALTSSPQVAPPAAPPATDTSISKGGQKTVPRSHRRRQFTPEE